MFIGIGFLTVPVSLVVSGLQSLILGAPDVAGRSRAAARVAATASPWPCWWPSSCSGRASCWCWRPPPTPSARSTAAPTSTRGAPTAWPWPAGGRCSEPSRSPSVLVGLLSLTVVLSPVAVVLILLFALFVPVDRVRGCGRGRVAAPQCRPGPRQLLKTAVLLATSILVAGALGPILGTILILVTGAPFPVANIVAGVTYAVLMPYVALTMAYLYFDARVRSELAHAEPASPGAAGRDRAGGDRRSRPRRSPPP